MFVFGVMRVGLRVWGARLIKKHSSVAFVDLGLRIGLGIYDSGFSA